MQLACLEETARRHGGVTDPSLQTVFVLKVSQLLSDRHVISMLAAMSFRNMSAQELSIRFEIPPAVCYRKIRELQELDLIAVDERALTRAGRRATRYRSNMQRAQISFNMGKYWLGIKLRGMPDELVIGWNPLEAGGKP